MESKKAELGIVDYALSQSTLEQVFLKQIRATDAVVDVEVLKTEPLDDAASVPNADDMYFGYLAWGCGFVIPGFHHFYFGDTSKGVMYFFSLNMFYVGWVMDGCEMHTIVQQSVQKHGHTTFKRRSVLVE
jgi:hypothetical protein